MGRVKQLIFLNAFINSFNANNRSYERYIPNKFRCPIGGKTKLLILNCMKSTLLRNTAFENLSKIQLAVIKRRYTNFKVSYEQSILLLFLPSLLSVNLCVFVSLCLCVQLLFAVSPCAFASNYLTTKLL